jgi:hypothetical protein
MGNNNPNDELIEVILKDVAKNTFLFDEKLHFNKVDRAIISFFDCQHKSFAAESPKDFIIYLKPESRPLTFFMIKLFVGEFTQGEGEDEETCQYNLEYPTPTSPAPTDILPDKVTTSFRLHIPKENRMKWEFLGIQQSELKAITSQPCKAKSS